MPCSAEALLVSSHHRLQKSPPSMKFKRGCWFAKLKLSELLYVSQRSEKCVGPLKESRWKRHTFLTFKGNTSLTYEGVCSFSLQTYDNHFAWAFQI